MSAMALRLHLLSLLAVLGCALAATSSLAVGGEPRPEQQLLGAADDDAVLVREQRAIDAFVKTLGYGGAGRANKDQSFNIGGLYQFDRQLLSQTVYKSSTILSVHSEYLNWSHATATIHCIQIVDLLKTGKNAVVTVQQGGIGQRAVTMKFKSLRGEKINYLAIIWGQ